MGFKPSTSQRDLGVSTMPSPARALSTPQCWPASGCWEKMGPPRETGLAFPSPSPPRPAAEGVGDILSPYGPEREREREGRADYFCSSPSLSPHPCPLVPLFPWFILFLCFHPIPASLSFLWSHFLSTSLIPILSLCFFPPPSLFFFYWRIIDLQYYISFGCTT